MNIEFPAKLQFLFRPSRYKIMYGGRGGAKSWGVARALLAIGAGRKIRVLCARELQKSIADSVHKLLSDQIIEMGLSAQYEVLQTAIRGRNGTEFAFSGLHHNATGLKSFEGVDICWVEEAQTVSKASWDILIPTIRKEESEIWVTFNPELEEDETYKRFVKNPPASAVVQKIDYKDNPWFPAVLEQERQDLLARDPDSYLTVWEGHCRQVLEGAIYANELRETTARGRITAVPHDKQFPVDVFFDLGWADSTAMWYTQRVGFEQRILKTYANSQHPIQHYLDHMQQSGYLIGTVWLPHDAVAKQLGSGKSIEEIVRAAGHTVRIVPRLSIADGINAARTIFHLCFFDADGCADGLNSLRRYRYDVNPDTGQYSKQPLHDEHSHYADGFRYLAIGISPGSTTRDKERDWRKKLTKRKSGSYMIA